MWDFFAHLLDTSDFPARWHCGHWTAGHGWLHIASDLAIFGAYFAIPVVLAFFVLRRRDVPFPPVFWLFASFILACGLGHLVEASMFWQPWYRLSGLVKVTTAAASWATVVALVMIMPQALLLPGLATQVQQRTSELATANAELHELNQLFIGREERMIELKREVNELARALGRPQPYDLSFAMETMSAGSMS